MSDKHIYTIDQSDADVLFLQTFNAELESLIGCVIEIFEDEPRMLLSPTFRKMVADKAKLVKSLHGPLKLRLMVDNPGNDLIPWKDA